MIFFTKIMVSTCSFVCLVCHALTNFGINQKMYSWHGICIPMYLKKRTLKRVLPSSRYLFKFDLEITLSLYYYFYNRYDLTDMARQALQLIFTEQYQNVVLAFKSKNMTELRKESWKLKDILNDLETVLASDTHFLLGNWIESAKSVAKTPFVSNQ